MQLLDGIEFLHAQGIIQRDLKPANILMADRNGQYIPKITDFGISKKTAQGDSQNSFVNSLQGVGTLSYSSPEQLFNDNILKNTDLWSFGVIAYWLLSGHLPFNTGTYSSSSQAGRSELFDQIKAAKLPSTIESIPQPWQLLIKCCLVSNPLERIQSVSECRIVLEVPPSQSTSYQQTISQETHIYDQEKEEQNDVVFSQFGKKYKQQYAQQFQDQTSYSQSLIKYKKKKKVGLIVVSIIGTLALFLALIFLIGTKQLSSKDIAMNLWSYK